MTQGTLTGRAREAELRELQEFALQVAHDAGRLTLGYFQSGVRPEFKPDDSPVTIADREAEQLIRARISERYPGHGVLGEEYPDSNAGASFRWYVDPIDG